MKYYIIPLFFLLIGAFQLEAKESKFVMMPYSVEGVERDSTLSENQSRLKIRVHSPSVKPGDVLRYGWDGKDLRVRLDENGEAIVKIKPGMHKLQFLINRRHKEITTDSIEFKGGFKTTIGLYFFNAHRPETVKKPVIYLYPEKEEKINLKLKVDGDLTFTYPAYNGQWNVTAQPSGELTIDGELHNYLFWEAEANNSVQSSEIKEGFVVKGSRSQQFLENTLKNIGLTSQERADFITFWGPQLAKNEANLLHFVMNEDCNRYAELEISPAPDRVNRVYLVWMPVSPSFRIPTQTLPKFDRSGFTVVEWGGHETEMINTVER